MRLLGIDYGERNIGLAISDDKGMMAFPHSVIQNKKDVNVVVEKISAIAKENGITRVIVGDSVNYKGEPNRIMDRIKPFTEALKSAGHDVVFEPELLSSHQAAHFQGKTAMIDAAAASIILQSYIDREKNK